MRNYVLVYVSPDSEEQAWVDFVEDSLGLFSNLYYPAYYYNNDNSKLWIDFQNPNNNVSMSVPLIRQSLDNYVIDEEELRKEIIERTPDEVLDELTYGEVEDYDLEDIVTGDFEWQILEPCFDIIFNIAERDVKYVDDVYELFKKFIDAKQLNILRTKFNVLGLEENLYKGLEILKDGDNSCILSLSCCINFRYVILDIGNNVVYSKSKAVLNMHEKYTIIIEVPNLKDVNFVIKVIKQHPEILSSLFKEV